jgi:Ni/Co efflux regulator RcnB
MRRALAALTALSLCLPAIAEAQRSERGRGEEAPPQAGPQAAPAPNQTRQAPNVAENRERRDFDRDRHDDDRSENDRDRHDGDRGRDFRGDRDRGDTRRYFNFRGRQYSAARGPAFNYPRGWSYRHWNRGEVLPRLFIGAPYFFDYGFLGLPPPPPGTRWVRYGPDALLITIRDGRIVDTIYDAFY